MTLLLQENFAVRKVTLQAVHFQHPCLAGVSPHETNEFHPYTMSSVWLYACLKILGYANWLCGQSTFGSRVYKGISPHEINEFQLYIMTSVWLYCRVKMLLEKKWLLTHTPDNTTKELKKN